MMYLSEAAAWLHAKQLGEDVRFESVGTDSRQIEAGQLFVALKGANFDGNLYAAEAVQRGAVAALVSDSGLRGFPMLLVADTRLALGQLAKHWRSQFKAPLVAVTGSNGKTTTKEMLTAILAVTAGARDQVHSTYGNLNNDIGLPLTLLRIRENHRYVVAEMGMNHLGEIDYLTRLAQPDVALINNAGTAHIGELGSRENIAKAKGEIFSGLSATGTAVINVDSEFADYWKSLNPNRKVITFGFQAQADVHASYHESDGVYHVMLTTPNGTVQVDLHVPGIHNLSNALAASAAAYALGVSNVDIAKGLASFRGVYGRLERKQGLQGACLIDDTYNANPDSMRAAIDVLAHEVGKKILVLGDMGELGEDAKAMHGQMGAYAKACGITRLFCLGELSQEMVHAFGSGAQHFASVEALATGVQAELSKDTVVLIKGSRFMRMERVVNLLMAAQET